MTILRHSPPRTQCSPHPGDPEPDPSGAGSSMGRIAAFVPQLQEATTAAAAADAERHLAHGAEANVMHEPLQTPTYTPQRLHKRAYVNTPADQKKLLKRSLETSRLPGHIIAENTCAGARVRGYRVVGSGSQNSDNGTDGHDSLQCHGAVSNRCSSDRSMATGEPVHACRERPEPFQPGAEYVAPPSLCGSLCMHASYDCAAAHSSSTDTFGAGSVQGSPHRKAHARFALVDESPDLSPAACVLQGLPDRKHGPHVLHSMDVLQQSCGEWFGSRSSGSGSRSRHLTYLQTSGDSRRPLHGHSVGINFEQVQECHSVSAENQTTGHAQCGPNPGPTPAPTAGPMQPPASLHPAHTLPASSQAVHDPQQPQQPQHTSDLEQASHACAADPSPEHAHATAQSTATSDPTHALQQEASMHDGITSDVEWQVAAQPADAIATSCDSVHSGSSYHGGLLETIACMRRTLVEDCGAPPSPQAIQQPVYPLSQLRSSAGGQIPSLHGMPHPAAEPVQDDTQSDAAAVSAPCAQQQAELPASGHPTSQAVPHMLGRCQGASCFTPSPHPKQKRRQPIVPPLQPAPPPAGMSFLSPLKDC